MLRPMEIPTHDRAALEAYCKPFLSGEKLPPTAVEMMASRYVAYATGAIDYLIETHDPKTRAQTDRKATEDWSKSADWRGLEIIATDKGGPDDDVGHVEFVARYAVGEVEHAHRERSLFRRIDKRWYFIDGKKIAAVSPRSAAPKPGRNDPCLCGSGKKYKKCCG